jgi:hypothetical protein
MEIIFLRNGLLTLEVSIYLDPVTISFLALLQLSIKQFRYCTGTDISASK